MTSSSPDHICKGPVSKQALGRRWELPLCRYFVGLTFGPEQPVKHLAVVPVPPQFSINISCCYDPRLRETEHTGSANASTPGRVNGRLFPSFILTGGAFRQRQRLQKSSGKS